MRKFFVILILLVLFATAIPASAQYTDVAGVRVGIKRSGWISGFAGLARGGRGGYYGQMAEGAIHVTNGVTYMDNVTYMECDTVGPDQRSKLSYRSERKFRTARIKRAKGKTKKADKLAKDARALAEGTKPRRIPTGFSCETYAMFLQHRGNLTIAVRVFSIEGDFLGWGKAEKKLWVNEFGSEAFYITELIRPAELTEQDDRDTTSRARQSPRRSLTDRYFKPGYVPPRRRN